ncbi:MAG: hypothetical protein OXT67_14020 [Zetaproteobacteria bacterium]|nr:hypothetical protein [Zetaproteobacteria bacterium]
MEYTQIPVASMMGCTLLSLKQKVFFSLCDMQMHLNATKFIQIALDHRYETVDRLLGISLPAIASTKANFVLGGMQANYQRPMTPHQEFYSANWVHRQTKIATWVRSVLFSTRAVRNVIHAYFEFEVIKVNTQGRSLPIDTMPSEKSLEEAMIILNSLPPSDYFCNQTFKKSEAQIFTFGK